MHKRAVLVIILLLTASCGYHIMTQASAFKYGYYIASITNNSVDLRITQDMSTMVTRFFSDYGSLRDKADANYMLFVTLTKKDVKYATTSSTREATTSTLDVEYAFKVEDKSGKVVYDKALNRAQTFTPSGSITVYDENLGKAFQELTNNVLSEFKYDFEISRTQ